MVLMLGSKEAHTINNSGTYDTYKDLCLIEKERKKKLLKGIQSANCLNAWFSEKKEDCTTITPTIQENAIKKTSDRRLGVPFKFKVFKDYVYFYGLIKDLLVRLKLNTSQKVILCSETTLQHTSLQ